MVFEIFSGCSPVANIRTLFAWWESMVYRVCRSGALWGGRSAFVWGVVIYPRMAIYRHLAVCIVCSLRPWRRQALQTICWGSNPYSIPHQRKEKTDHRMMVFEILSGCSPVANIRTLFAWWASSPISEWRMRTPCLARLGTEVFFLYSQPKERKNDHRVMVVFPLAGE